MCPVSAPEEHAVDIGGDGSIGAGDWNNADLLLIELGVDSLFAGVPDGVGFAIEEGTLGLAILKRNVADPDPASAAGFPESGT